AAAVLVLSAHHASAQAASQEPFRRWDVATTLGLKFGNKADQVVPQADWDVTFGRYWTAHLKTDFTMTATNQRRLFVSSRNPPEGGYEAIRAGPHQAGVRTGITYQFLENAFVHPYVSSGVRIAWVDTFRDSYAPRVFSMTTERLSSGIASRAFVAGGFKSYFDN